MAKQELQLTVYVAEAFRAVAYASHTPWRRTYEEATEDGFKLLAANTVDSFIVEKRYFRVNENDQLRNQQYTTDQEEFVELYDNPKS